jgi:hypothetical protein
MIQYIHEKNPTLRFQHKVDRENGIWLLGMGIKNTKIDCSWTVK